MTSWLDLAPALSLRIHVAITGFLAEPCYLHWTCPAHPICMLWGCAALSVRSQPLPALLSPSAPTSSFPAGQTTLAEDSIQKCLNTLKYLVSEIQILGFLQISITIRVNCDERKCLSLSLQKIMCKRVQSYCSMQKAGHVMNTPDG